MHAVKDSLLSAQDMPIQKRKHRKNYAETRQRMRWTKEMNLEIVHCYFKAIISSSTSYRQSMHRYWKQLYPDTTFTEQRIADQKKQIFCHANNTNTLSKRGHWLTNLEIEAIKSQIINKDGKFQVEYYPCNKLKGSTTHCGKIASPKTNEAEVIESCLSIYNLIKTKEAPDGVLLDPTKISKSLAGTYKEGKDYDVMDEILGKGLNGQIAVVRDRVSKTDHALKTVMLALFNPNEIRAWVSLEGCSQFPNLYMFNKIDGKIELHHEILKKAVTLADVINDRMGKLREYPSLLHHFSLYVLHGLLEASSTMHSKKWLHDDIHEENVMLQPQQDPSDSPLRLRMIDFGRVKNLKEDRVVNDIQGIIRIFTSVYLTEKFNDVYDLQKNWETKLDKHSDDFNLSYDHKQELLALVKLALDVTLTKEEEDLKRIVSKKLKDSREEAPEILEDIAKLIFPENFPVRFLHLHSILNQFQ
ncbi:Calcium-dependent kinase 4 [Octopus vulgaris]|uniref:Calcium-dependent kinase 4 n=1 Tax=Octopus vulgaris TaxID=6645 RepID=A0AA36ANR3_OCTVU|nr:Calcium-dependent kinase 4 [Octopus vulgaris]